MKNKKYLLYQGANKRYFIKASNSTTRAFNGRNIAGFVHREDALLFVNLKASLDEGGSTVEDQTG